MSTAQTVPPRTGRLEAAVVALAFVAVVGATLAYAATRPDEPPPPPLQDWQISAFAGLSPTDQAIHQALYAADTEIYWYNYRVSDWPTIEDMQEEYIAPFVEDGFWEANGSVEWHLGVPFDNENDSFNAQGATYYHGSHGTIPGQGAYLLVLAHIHAGASVANQSTIWINKNPNAPFPTITRPEALILAGWKQVVPYNGADELERLKGKTS